MTINIRVASEDDYQRIYDWRNDAVTISTSRSGSGLEWNVIWHRLDNPQTIWLIGEYERQPFGVTWFKRGRSEVYESSIILSPEFRGRKLSAPLLSSSLEWTRSKHGAKFFAAEIKDDNSPSIRIFESCGFVYVHPTPGGFGAYCTGVPVRQETRP